MTDAPYTFIAVDYGSGEDLVAVVKATDKDGVITIISADTYDLRRLREASAILAMPEVEDQRQHLINLWNRARALRNKQLMRDLELKLKHL